MRLCKQRFSQYLINLIPIISKAITIPHKTKIIPYIRDRIINYGIIMLKITAPRLIKALQEIPDLGDLLSGQGEELIDSSFKGQIIEEIKLPNLSVNGCLFTNCNFMGCDFKKSQFSDVVFKNCDLSNINLSGSGFYRVEFIECKLTGINFSESIFNHTILQECRAQYAVFSMNKFRNVLFSACDLRESGMDNCQFTGVEFEKCDLREAEFHRTPLKGIDLTTSEISGLRITSFPGSEWRGATVTSLQALEIVRTLGLVIND